MSAFGMKPQFKDRAGYLRWRQQWKIVYKEVVGDIRRSRTKLAAMQRAGTPGGKWQKELGFKRVMAAKLMTLLNEAKLRRDMIIKLEQGIREARSQYPLAIDDCRFIDFHFNKKHLEFPAIPMWVVKTRGKTYYVDHVEAFVPWTTKETPDHTHTKGSIRLRHCSLSIDKDGTATIR